MAAAAREKGLDYLAVTDHSKKVTVANGLDEERLSGQIDEIEEFNRNHDGIRVLRSSEVDILEDGSLDLPDEILERLDVCIIAVHSKFNLPETEQTERIVAAMHNPNAHILAHPTGRLINEREPYDVDMERVIEAAKETGTIMEVNASPHRLDMADNYCKMAREKGVKVAISTDAHSTDELNMMKYGVWQARRGWLEPEDVVNTRSWSELNKLLGELKTEPDN
jgi:DNA polymerase (family 10)